MNFQLAQNQKLNRNEQLHLCACSRQRLLIWQGEVTGTLLLTAIGDASWIVNDNNNGV